MPVDQYTPIGYVSTMEDDTRSTCVKRLNRIEGQVRGIARMVEDDRYCIDVMTQIAAVRAALQRVEDAILKDHVGHCVQHAITAGDRSEQRKKIEELVALLARR